VQLDPLDPLELPALRERKVSLDRLDQRAAVVQVADLMELQGRLDRKE
jgi:hypothetical protein